ncbi:MAG TPA: FIST N-terminal domain-containing protein [Vicinamibacteria bacterium]
MATIAGSGRSTHVDSRAAAAEAVRMAQAPLGDARPTFGLLFASPRHDLGAALAAAEEASGAAFFGCTTAGEITEKGLTKGQLAAMVVSTDQMEAEVSSATGVKADPKGAARQLCEGFSRAAKAAAGRGFGMSSSVLLVDGLNGVGEDLVGHVLGATRSFQQVVGGAAGDDGAFQATYVGARGRAATDSAVVLHAFSRKPWGVGVDHGLKPTGRRMRVTRARRNVVQQIDGRPAFDVYKEYAAGRGVKLTAENAGPFLIGNELGIFVFDEMRRARAPLSVGADGSLACAAEIAQGASVSILDGEPASMVEAARRAAQEAKKNLGGERAAGVLLFDCVCRGMILNSHFGREIEAVRSVFPDVPITGLLTYGEIARFKGRLDGWHNTTAVVAAIPA